MLQILDRFSSVCDDVPAFKARPVFASDYEF